MAKEYIHIPFMTISGITSAYISYDYNKNWYQKANYFQTKKEIIVPNHILIAPTVSGFVLGVAFYPIVGLFAAAGAFCMISDEYYKWAEKEIKKANI